MPKDTFFNLNEDKRNRIIEAAMTEFENYSFENASTNRIVESAGISKGSFYQYFDDKKDLYMHIIHRMVEAKVAYVTPAMKNPFGHDLMDLIHDMNLEGLRFAANEPRYMKIGLRLLQDRNQDIYREVMEENQVKSLEVYKMLVKSAKDKGELRPDLDVELTARLIMIMSIEIIHLVTNGYEEIDEKTIMPSLDKLMDILAYGIKNREVNHD